MSTSARTKAHNEAFAEGRSAHQAGKPLSSNRYESVHLHAAFKDGWHDAATDASVARVVGKPAAKPSPWTPQQRAAMQVGTLRELVLSYHAFIRSRNEFFNAIGYDEMNDDDKCTVDREVAEWLEERAPVDGRAVDENTLHALFCHLPTDGK